MRLLEQAEAIISIGYPSHHSASVIMQVGMAQQPARRIEILTYHIVIVLGQLKSTVAVVCPLMDFALAIREVPVIASYIKSVEMSLPCYIRGTVMEFENFLGRHTVPSVKSYLVPINAVL